MIGRGVLHPVRGGNRLHPLHPDGIVDMAHDVDMIGACGEGWVKDWA
jgi:hypothetical protein